MFGKKLREEIYRLSVSLNAQYDMIRALDRKITNQQKQIEQLNEKSNRRESRSK